MSDLTRIVVVTDKDKNNEEVFTLSIDKGVVIKNNQLWNKLDWKKSKGNFLTLDTVLEEVPNLVENKLPALKLELTSPNQYSSEYTLNLVDQKTNSPITSIDLTPLKSNVTLDLGEADDILNIDRRDNKIPTTKAVGEAIDLVVGWTINRIDEV